MMSRFDRKKNKAAAGKRALAGPLLLAVILAAGGCAGAGTAPAPETEKQQETGENTKNREAAEENAFCPRPGSPTVTPGRKEETVNVKADAGGTPYEVVVEAELSEIAGRDPILDRSDLRDIRNREGGEAFYRTDDGMLYWENLGNAVKYEGYSDKELPVDVRVTYYLDGQELSPAEIAGKSGDVRIRFDYDNRTVEQALRRGEEDPVCVPFMAISTLILPKDIFSQVSVENGRTTAMGDNTIVIGAAFPGLEESLRPQEYEPTEEIEIPSYVEISAHAEKFALDFTATMLGTGLFKEIEEEDLDDADGVRSDMDELKDASREMADGAGELADGAGELGDYLDKYFSGVSALKEGAGSMEEGLGLLSEKAASLQEGADAMQTGLQQIDTALGALDPEQLAGAAEDPQLKAAAEAAASLEEDGQKLTALLSDTKSALAGLSEFSKKAAAHNESLEKAKAALAETETPGIDRGKLGEELAAQVNGQVGESWEAAQEEVRAQALDAALQVIEEQEGLDDETKESLKSGVTERIASASAQFPEITLDLSESESLDEAEQSAADAVSEAKGVLEGVNALELTDLEALASLDTETMGTTVENMGKSLETLAAGLEASAGSAEAVTALQEQLGTLRKGIAQLTKGSEGLSEGVAAFSTGIGQLKAGAEAFSEGLSQIAEAGGELGNAYCGLAEGLQALADGIEKFDEEAIGELADLAGEDLTGLIGRIRAVRWADLQYSNFSGILEGQEGSVRFLIETDEISAEN